MVGNDRKLPGMAENGWGWPKMVGDSRKLKLLEMVGNGQRWLEMAGDGRIYSGGEGL